MLKREKLMGEDILLSIVIPTYNRYQYLEGCLRSICTVNSNKFEIVVQDNSEDNSQGISIVETINDDRIKYFYIKGHMPVCDNNDAAINNSKGKYVCLLGDDDTVCENIISLIEEMDKRNIDTCVFGITTYHWPDLMKQKHSLNCFESVKYSGMIVKRDPQKILDKYLREGFQDISEMPRVYHAISSRKVLNEIRIKTGSYFPGPSPDMANAVGCALFSKYHIQIDVPVMVSGYGGKSVGGMGRMNQHRGALTDKPWLPKNTLEVWDPKIPQLWMGDTIWPASAISSLKAMHRDDLVLKMNYGAVYGELLIHEKSLRVATMNYTISFSDFCRMINRVIFRICKKIFRIGSKKTIVISSTPIDLIEAKRIQDKENESYVLSKLFTEMRDE